MDALASLQLTDKVTFATMNVFGRNLNGISKVSSRAGRDHYGNHNVGVLIGENVAPRSSAASPPPRAGAGGKVVKAALA